MTTWQYVKDDIVHAVRANHTDAAQPYVQIWCSPFDIAVYNRHDQLIPGLVVVGRLVTCLGCISKSEWW